MELKITVISLALALSATAQIKKGDTLPTPNEQQAEYYEREPIPLPQGETIEVSSLALLPNKQIAIATRRGQIWVATGAYDQDLTKVTWKKAYTAAHEPLGMFYKDGWLYLTDREAVGRIKDHDGDGRYDEYQTISNAWGITADYHEYAFGSTPDKDGNILTVHCLTGSFHAHAKYRGWALKITPDGKTIPMASGVRSPGGIGFNAQGEPFYTDNQGPWNGTSSLKHLKQGGFMGNPTGNIFYPDTPDMGPRPQDPKSGSHIAIEASKIPEYIPPAVQIPHGKVGQSPTAVITDHTKGKFGPFANQLLIGEQTHAQVQRIFLEEINGVYQGAVWKFLDGFQCGIIPMRLADDGTLFVGGSNRGWASIGGKTFTLERVRWKNKTPFEMLTMQATPTGFKLTFTEPLDPKTATNPDTYKMNAWTYIYQKDYGSPEVDKLTPKITKATLSNNNKTVTIEVDKLTQGHIHHLDCTNLKSKTQKPLWHPNSYYTLNQIPTH